MISKRTYKMTNKNGTHKKFFFDNQISTIWYVQTLNNKVLNARERRYVDDDIRSEYPIKEVPIFIQEYIDNDK